MIRKEKMNYSVRLSVTVKDTLICLILGGIAGLVLFFYANGFFFLKSTHYTLILRMGEVMIAMTLFIIYVLLSVLLIRSMRAKTEEDYPLKLFKWLGKVSIGCCILNILTFLLMIYLLTRDGNKDIIGTQGTPQLVEFILIYMLSLFFAGSMIHSCSQFFSQPSAQKTWRYNAQTYIWRIIIYIAEGISAIILLFQVL